MIDENELMLQVQNGQLESLALLFENNKVRLFNFFRRMGNAPEISEDLVQETFMRVLSYRSTFNGSASFRTWLYGIARNTSVDHYRKYKQSLDHEEFDDTTPDDKSSLCEQMVEQQSHSLFNKALASIPIELREILVLSRYSQLKYEEIALMVNCNLNTLKSRMTLAVSKLKESYNRLNGEELT